jgi:hypothetical protein
MSAGKRRLVMTGSHRFGSCGLKLIWVFTAVQGNFLWDGISD